MKNLNFLRTYGLAIVLVIVLIISGVWYVQNRTLQGVSQLDAEQVAKLVDVVGELVVLPEPLDVASVQVAAVQDADRLRTVSQFFREANNGDQLLIFPTKLVLFRPSENKIVNMSAPSGVQEMPNDVPSIASATSTTSETTEGDSSSSQPSRTLTVEIRNGSGKTGLAGSIRTRLGTFSQLEVVRTGNASRDSYESSVIINKNNFPLPDISSVVRGTTQQSLPEGESETTADILIILGSDAS